MYRLQVAATLGFFMQQKGELALRSGESRGKMFGSKVLEKEAIRRTCLALLALVLAGVLLVLWAGPADAATTFTVNFTGDANDRRITDTVCDTSRERGKQCTLRAAIQEANVTTGADTIN